MARARAKYEITARDRTRGAVSSAQAGFARLNTGALKLSATVGTLAGVGGFGALVAVSLKSADALAKQADKLGLTTQALAGLRHAAELTGVSSGDLDTALQRMTRRLAEAAQGTGSARSAIQDLGLDARALAAQSPDQAFRAITEAMQGVESQSDKVRLAFKLFDSGGVGLINTMAGGVEALDEYAREVELLGVALDRVDAAKIEAANDSIYRLQTVVRGAGLSITASLAPYLEAAADWFTELAKRSGGFGDVTSTVLATVLRGTAQLIDTFRPVASAIATMVGDIWSGFKALPDWAQQIGVLGALMGGKKGLFLISAMAKFTADAQTTGKWWAAYSEGKVGFIEWMTTGHDEAQAKLAEMQTEVEKTAAAGLSGPSLIAAMTGSEAEKGKALAAVDEFLADVADRRVELERKIAAAEAARRSIVPPNPVAPAELATAANDSGADEKERARLQTRVDALQQSLMTEEERLAESLARRQELVQQAFEADLLGEQERKGLLIALEEQHSEKLGAIHDAAIQKQLQKERDLQSRVSAMRQSATDLAIGLLRSLGGQSKKYAIAAIAVEKGLAIARTIQNTAVAIMKSQALNPYDFATPSRIKALGALQIGLIAATGLSQAAGVGGGGGGASAGSAGGPPVQTSAADGGTGTGRAAPQITVHVASGGTVVGNPEQLAELVAQGVQAAMDRDMISTESGSIVVVA